MGIFQKLGEHLNLMSRMSKQCGVADDLEAMASLELGLQNAIWRCVGCRNTEQCKQWLDEGGENRSAPTFCANADAFNMARQR